MTVLSFDPKAAHEHCTHNEAELARSSLCGCFHCMQTFAPDAIAEWIEEFVEPLGRRSGRTAICPKCGIDSVIGDASSLPVGSPEFLNEMNECWFAPAVPVEALRDVGDTQ